MVIRWAGMMGDDDNGDNDDCDDLRGVIRDSATTEGSPIIIRQPFSWRSKYTRASNTQAHPSIHRASHLSPVSVFL